MDRLHRRRTYVVKYLFKYDFMNNKKKLDRKICVLDNPMYCLTCSIALINKASSNQRNLMKNAAAAKLDNIYLIALIYRRHYFGGRKCRCTARLDGLVIIITGGNSGIGKALAFELADRGATLILACRNIEAGIQVKEAIYKKIYKFKPNIYVKSLDLNSIQSIIKFAESVNIEFKEIYGLVNNAGVFYHPHQITGDGYDITFQTNYLGPFILTHYLMKSLKRSDHGRIVNVASDAHNLVNAYQLNAIIKNQVETRTNFAAYGASKLALILFTREFAKKIAKTNVIINTVDPGNVETAIFRHFPPLNNPWLFALQYPIRLVVVKRPVQGCQTVLHALLTSNHSSGQYLVDCRPVLPSAVALNDKIAKDIYELTMQKLDGVFSTESDC